MYNLVNIKDSEDTNNNEPMDDTEVVFVAKDRKSLKEPKVEAKREKRKFAKKVVRPGVGFGDDDIDACVQVNEAEAHAMIGDKPIVEENRKNNQKSEVEMANDFANTTMSTDSLQSLEDDDNI
jgi:hypothetical protein